MVQRVQVKRTPTNNNPPADNSLSPGELFLEMGVPTRLWAGVSPSIIASGKKLLLNTTALVTSVNGNAGDVTVTPANIGALPASGGNITGSLTVGGVAVSLSGHGHTISDVANLQTALDGKAASGHTHAIAQVTGLQTELNNKQPLDPDLTSIAELTGDGYLARIAGGWALTAENFAPLNHTHPTSQVVGLDAALAGKAPLASPAFTGTPTTPQAAAYANTQTVANTAQVYSTVTTVPESYQTASYTLALADAGKMVTFDSTNAVTLTIPPFADVGLPINVRIDLLQLGSGQVSVAPGAGVTLLSRDSKKKLSGVCAGATLWKVGPNTWVLIGDIAA